MAIKSHPVLLATCLHIYSAASKPILSVSTINIFIHHPSLFKTSATSQSTSYKFLTFPSESVVVIPKRLSISVTFSNNSSPSLLERKSIIMRNPITHPSNKSAFSNTVPSFTISCHLEWVLCSLYQSSSLL